MFEGPETFVIGNDSIKRRNVHSKNKFVFNPPINTKLLFLI